MWKLIDGDPWALAALFALGLTFGGSGAWWVQGLRLDAVQAEYDGFVATTKAQGEAAKKLAAVASAEYERKKKSSDHDYQTTIANLRADVKRMRDARASYVPAAPASSRRADLACFDRAELERTLQQFDDAITGLFAEGDAGAVGLNVARSWAAGIRPDTSH